MHAEICLFKVAKHVQSWPDNSNVFSNCEVLKIQEGTTVLLKLKKTYKICKVKKMRIY